MEKLLVCGGAVGFLAAAWAFLDSNALDTLRLAPAVEVRTEITVDDILAERTTRQLVAEQDFAGRSSADGTLPELGEEELIRQADFDYFTLIQREQDALVFQPFLEPRTSPDGMRYFVQSSHPMPYHFAGTGSSIEEDLARGVEAGNFEYGHFVKNTPEDLDLYPGVLVQTPGYPEGVVVRRSIFEAMLRDVSLGISVRPEDQPWAGSGLWTTRADNLAAFSQNANMRTTRALAEHMVGTSDLLCAFINPTHETIIDSLRRDFTASGGITEFATSLMTRDDVERVAEVANVNFAGNIEEVTSHFEGASVPETVRVPISVEVDGTGMFSMPRDHVYMADGIVTYRCETSSSDYYIQRSSLAFLGQPDFRPPSYIPALDLLPVQPTYGFIVYGNPVARVSDGGLIVSWQPLRFDFTTGGALGFGGRYLVSFDLSTFRYVDLRYENGGAQQ